MNKQFIISSVVMFVWLMLIGFVVHGVILAPEYANLTGLFRPMDQQEAYFLYLVLGHVTMAIGLTWVYRMGREDKPWLQQGIRFALAIIVLMTLSHYLIFFAVQPMPSGLAMQQVIYDAIGMVSAGILVAYLNK